MATTPKYYENSVLDQVEVTTANANYDGTGAIVTVVTGAASETRIETLKIQAIGTPAVGAVNLFIDDGSTVKFFKEIPVLADVRFSVDTALSFILPNGHILKASTLETDTFNLFVTGGDY